MTVNSWLASATSKLQNAGISSARLDAELILAHALGVGRTWLIAHGEEPVTTTASAAADTILRRRLEREPIAYIIGHKEFYGRSFIVTPDTLIPRPESETLIELAKLYLHSRTAPIRVLDVGTGSGCLGLTLAKELPDVRLTLSDLSPDALTIARKNARSLEVKPVRFIQSNLLEHWLSHGKPKPFDVIVANLPYVDKSWKRSPETDYEPSMALFAGSGGLELILKLIEQAALLLTPEGHLLLEADPEQHESIIEKSNNHGFKLVENRDYAVLLKR